MNDARERERRSQREAGKSVNERTGTRSQVHEERCKPISAKAEKGRSEKDTRNANGPCVCLRINAVQLLLKEVGATTIEITYNKSASRPCRRVKKRSNGSGNEPTLVLTHSFAPLVKTDPVQVSIKHLLSL
jgi:hypothetical protein